MKLPWAKALPVLEIAPVAPPHEPPRPDTCDKLGGICWAQYPLQAMNYADTNCRPTTAVLYSCDVCGNYWTQLLEGAFTLEDFLKAKPSNPGNRNAEVKESHV